MGSSPVLWAAAFTWAKPLERLPAVARVVGGGGVGIQGVGTCVGSRRVGRAFRRLGYGVERGVPSDIARATLPPFTPALASVSVSAVGQEIDGGIGRAWVVPVGGISARHVRVLGQTVELITRPSVPIAAEGCSCRTSSDRRDEAYRAARAEVPIESSEPRRRRRAYGSRSEVARQREVTERTALLIHANVAGAQGASKELGRHPPSVRSGASRCHIRGRRERLDASMSSFLGSQRTYGQPSLLRQSLPPVPRDALGVRRDAPPALRDALRVRRDAPPAGAASHGAGAASQGVGGKSRGRRDARREAGGAWRGTGGTSRGTGSAWGPTGSASLRARTLALDTRSDARRARSRALGLRGASVVRLHRIAPMASGIPTKRSACERRNKESARSSKRIAASVSGCSRSSDSTPTNGERCPTPSWRCAARSGRCATPSEPSPTRRERRVP
jgi:hypothetical protein